MSPALKHALASLTLIGLAVGCGGPRAYGSDAASPHDREAAKAAASSEAWLDREEGVRLSRAAVSAAITEAAASERAAWYGIGARLLTRVFRETRKAEDGKEATNLLASAAREGTPHDACTFGAERAALEGEIAHDSRVTYAEAYRELRKREARSGNRDAGGAPTCATLDRMLKVFEAFRPAPAVLEGIDQEVAGIVPKQQQPPRVERVEHWSGPEGGRLVVFLSRAATFRVLDEGEGVNKAGKTYIEIDGAESAGQRTIPMSGLVRSARLEPVSTGTRISLDLAAPAFRKVFHLVEPYRLVIDVARREASAVFGDRRRVTRVVLDPGHGGHDTGATGLSGLHEKAVTLEIAKRVAPVLARQGMQVALTRDEDRFVDLEERAARANAFGADLFLSLHCNASEGHSRRGVETYILDTTSNEVAQKVAARENATSQAASAETATILTNLRLAEQASLSTRFAELLQRASIVSLNTKYPDVVDGGVHPAGFYVLVGARMPAALFEMSYISNAMEEQRLGSSDYQARLADGVVNAILAYREGR